jgi:hypothetical protein
LPRVGGERLYVAALAFGVNGVKGEGGFAGTADSGNYCDGIVRDVYGNVFEVVDARTDNPEKFLLGERSDDFRGSQREAQTAGFRAHCLNFELYVDKGVQANERGRPEFAGEGGILFSC